MNWSKSDNSSNPENGKEGCSAEQLGSLARGHWVIWGIPRMYTAKNRIVVLEVRTTGLRTTVWNGAPQMTRFILSIFLTLIMVSPVLGGGLNTDVALTPPEGGTIVRTQWRLSEFDDDPTTDDREVTLNAAPVTVVHGITSKLTFLTTVPFVHQEVDIGATGEELDEFGISDIPVLAKYRFYQKDEPGQTTRWAAIGGIEVPTHDEPFSSESGDPIVGTVWTHQAQTWWLDWDLLYKSNTGDGLNSDDKIRADVAASYTLLGGNNETFGPWRLYGIGELNATALTDGSTEVLGSPGLQFITPQWIVEAGVQLPVHQDMEAPRLKRNFTSVLSVRFQF